MVGLFVAEKGVEIGEVLPRNVEDGVTEATCRGRTRPGRARLVWEIAAAIATAGTWARCERVAVVVVSHSHARLPLPRSLRETGFVRLV